MARPLNLAYVSHNSHLRMGGQRSLVLLVEHLDRSRVNPLVICPKPGELEEELRRIDCPVVHIPLHRIKPRTLPAVVRSARRIRALLRERAIDIISPDAARDAFTCGLAKLATSTRMVWHVRLTSSDNLDPVNQHFADGMIGVSDATRRRFSSSPRISARYRTIMDGVDLRAFHPADDRNAIRGELGLPQQRFTLIFVGQLTDRKGVLDIVDAMALLRQRLPNPEMPLLLLIGTPIGDRILGQVERRVTESGLEECCRVLSQQAGIQAWMQAADALVIASHEGQEGLSRVLFEAMACGAVVIGTDISGNREAFTPESGILVPEKSPAGIAGAVEMLMKDKARVTALRTHGIRRAQEVFDIRTHAQRVQDFYEELLRPR